MAGLTTGPRGPGILFTLLRLRLLLWSRTLEKRPRVEQALAWFMPPIGAVLVVALFDGAYRFASELSPQVLATGCAVGLVGIHIPLLVAVVRRAAEGEGGAAALVLFPIPAWALHAVEVLQGIPTLLVLSSSVALAGAFAAASSILLGVLGGVVVGVYLAGIRQLFRLVLAGVLRRRGVREVVLAGASLAGLAAWLLAFTYSEAITRFVTRGLSGTLPDYFWWLPVQWFVLPAAAPPEVPGGAVLAAWIGAPLLTLAVFVAGAEVQGAILLGETASRRGRSRRRRRTPGRFLDRLPLSVIPPAVWAVAGKELRLLGRNPFFVVMLLGQGLLWIALPFLYAALGVRVTGGDAPTWLPFVAMASLLGMQSFTFNQLGSEGRGMHFLAQSPVARLHVLLGKNLAYAAIGGPVAALSILVAALVFGERGAGWFILAAELGVLLMLGVGNLVSVLLPRALLGARGVSGGSKAAQAAAAGALPPNGCLVSIVSSLAVGSLTLLALPVVGGVAFAAVQGGRWPSVVLPGVIAYTVLVWLVLTVAASARLQAAEAWILSQIAGKEAG